MRLVQPHPSVVYFAREQATGNIKIGTTEDIHRRINDLRSVVKSEVILIGVMPGSEETEAEIHRRFAAFRAEGEWFLPGDELCDFIAANARPCPSKPARNPFRSVKKVHLGATVPRKVVEAVKILAARDGLSLSEATTLLLCSGLGIDPSEFGIRPNASRNKAAS